MTASPGPGADAIEQINDQAALDRLCDDLRHESIVAVDTEAASFHRYHDRVYLLQLSSRTRTAVVDPLAAPDFAGLGRLLTDPAVEVIFHDADYDLRLLDHEHGVHATQLFDTRVAAQFLNEPGIGLAALLEKYVGVKLDKRFQRADWSVRPLSQGMIDYAAMDTHYLPQLRDILRGQLEARGRLTWAEEEFGLLEHVRWGTDPDDGEGFLRMKGAKALKGRSLAILRELFNWREENASRMDRAAFRILNNEALFALAQSPPADLAALKATSGVGRDLAERRGTELLAAIQRALELPDRLLPRVERPPRRAPDPAVDARLERLKATRNELATKYELAPGVLCPNGTLEAIARANPRAVDALGDIPTVRRWQAETFGEDLVQASIGPSP